MDHQAVLIETLAIGLGAAFVGGMLARRLRLPTMVGYLVAGIAVGPFTPGLVADPEIAPQLAELGVILLMFGVGIQFSIPELLAVRGIAVPGAIGHSFVAAILGAGLGIALGWGFAGGLVLGLAISVASTVVLLRALTERNELDTPQGRIAIGFVIVEDVFTIVVLVLLPTLAPLLSGQGGVGLGSSLVEVLVALGKAVLFAALMLVAGRRIVPWILGAVAQQRSRELFTLAVLAMAVGIAFVASSVFGVSFALGAFLAGVVLSESDLSHQAAADALPLRDAFAVLFFVSVGMLMDPGYLVREPVAVLAVTLLIVGAKSVAAFVIVAAFGYPVRVALTVSAALAQVGEFSFILATLGRTLDLIPPDAFQLVVAGALVSIALNALLFRLVEPLEAWIRARPAVLGALERRPRGLSHLYPGRREELRGHAILCGYGRVGRLVAAGLERRGLQYVVVSDDRREIERLRARGISALYGDAANAELLGEAHLPRARVVIVALPDAHAARLVVDRVRDEAPRVPLVVRTHGAAEASFLRSLGPTVQAVHAEREVAIQLTRFSLRRFGLSTIEVDAIASGLRDRDRAEPGTGAPAGRSAGARESIRRWVERRRSASTLEVVLEASAGLEAAGAETEAAPADAAEPGAAALAEAAMARVEAETARVEAEVARVEADLGGGAGLRAGTGEPPAPSVLSGPAEPSAPSGPIEPSAPPGPTGSAEGALEPLRRWFGQRRSAFARVVSPRAPTAPEAAWAPSPEPRTEPDSRAEPAEVPAEPAVTPRARAARPRAKPRAEDAGTSPEPPQPQSEPQLPLAKAAKRQSKPRAEAGEPQVPPQPQSEAAVTPRARAARHRGPSAPPAAPD